MLEKYNPKVKLVFKNFPLRNHRMAMPAAKAALAAGEQGKFWEFHDNVFEHHRNLSEDLFIQFAQELGIDMESFDQDRNSRETAALINRDLQEGRRAGVRGTPTMFINGKRLNRPSLESISEEIEKELGK